jgi:pimeloyl-ACP methyl ester carboxylesterase
MPSPSSRAERGRVRTGLVVTGTAVVVLVTAFLAWAASPMIAEAGPLADARDRVTVTESSDSVVLTPASPNGIGLVFLAGARVEPAAYADKLTGVAEAGITVVIARPTLNFALFDLRPLTDFEAAAPGVTTWYVGGHSLGGVKACSYAAQAASTGDMDAVAGLVLFGSYCNDDISGTSLPVLTLVGEHDGLSTPDKVAAAAHLLPATAQVVQLDGATHAQFGDYGVQPGDGTSTTTDEQVRDAIAVVVPTFLEGIDQE